MPFVLKLLTTGALLWCLPVLADEKVQDRVPVAPTIDASEIASLGISLVVVIAAILFVGWIYSRVRVGGGSGADVIDVVASRALGPKERMMIIQVADRQLLVGMTASQMQTLHVFDTPVIPKQSSRPQTGFAGRLRAALAEVGK